MKLHLKYQNQGDEVTITTELYGDIDLNTTLIIWKINGKEAQKVLVKKKKEFKFTMSESGKLVTIDFEAVPTNAPVFLKHGILQCLLM